MMIPAHSALKNSIYQTRTFNHVLVVTRSVNSASTISRTISNGLCPACRRPYDEKTIKWKVVTPEEVAQFKANVQKNAKKKAEIRQKKHKSER
ncbi:hypothetical protein DID88_004463 [Monilinia fructigena]|uniref:Uncharacterized protein n=1 Tax=Monilinia fructigena TaxID=38457 RepID=A0A395IRC3_9HELO|nr:hypothetical protein DID88_004463 [Monilinia fructigena]